MLRDLGTIEAELRLLAVDRHAAPRRGLVSSGERIDDLLDEWNRSLTVLKSYGVQFWPD